TLVSLLVAFGQFLFFSSRRRHTRSKRDWSSDVCSSDLEVEYLVNNAGFGLFGLAVERDRAEQLNMISVNIRALTDLTLRFADQRSEERRVGKEGRPQQTAGWRSKDD